MVGINFIKKNFGILARNPALIPDLFSFDFDRTYCSYWKLKLKECGKYYNEIDKQFIDNRFLEQIKKINQEIIAQKNSRHEALYIPLYLMVRILKPEYVIETGVHRGVSSLFILKALNDNNRGILYSIDLPLAEYDSDTRGSTKSILPPEKIGICIPDNLRKRWNLILGDSKKELPPLLAKIQTIDMFVHDSEHTYEHMVWEFQTVWPYIKSGGLLIADDTNWNDAFEKFVGEVGCDSMQLNRDKGVETFGMIIKK